MTSGWRVAGGADCSLPAIRRSLWFDARDLCRLPVARDFPHEEAVDLLHVERPRLGGQGLLAQDLPWGLVFVGMAIAVVVELCGVRSLSFAVGAYLPLSTTLPIFVGGALKGLMDRRAGHAAASESEVSPGMLYSTGLVAGGSLTGEQHYSIVRGAVVSLDLAGKVRVAMKGGPMGDGAMTMDQRMRLALQVDAVSP